MIWDSGFRVAILLCAVLPSLAVLGHSELHPPQTVLVFELGVVITPIRNLPATLLYCCPVTVLEWNSGHVSLLSPVAKLKPPIFHLSHPYSGYDRLSGDNQGDASHHHPINETITATKPITRVIASFDNVVKY